jgi:ribonuclease G
MGVDQEIRSTLNRRVDLPSGGYLIFDYAEAFTVIDVNTGRFVGSRSKKSGARLEDTITKNNLEAVKEVVRQLRLRDIGGIIVIDFIDMASPKNRAAVEKALGEELERDRTKTYVVEISPLGLVEMTRQNVTDGPREVMTKKCPTCGGDGIVISEHTAAVDVERRLRSLVTPGSRDKAFKVEVAAKVAWLVAGPGGSRLREIEETTKRRFFLVGVEGEHLDHLRVLDQGTLEKVAPKLPVEVGQQVEVKLGEVGLHDSHAGVGKVDDVDIVVGDAAKLVGKKVTVTIAAVTDGLAWAELVAPAEVADEPLTAESEAEKPTRAKRSSARKTAEAEDDTEVEDADDEAADEVDDDVELDDGAELDAVADGDEAVPTVAKKRTRRGSRGGKNRKRKTATATGAASANGDQPAAEAEPEAEPEPDDPAPEAEAAEAPSGPVIHLPDRNLAGDEADENGTAPVKKKTRRGSRGGKNRKRKPAGAAGAVATVEPDTAPEPEIAIPEPETGPEPEPVSDTSVADRNGDEDWGYTPMSQWGLDE